ncbi:unnamed protein product (macronuclear) [Paramecium tetraurelia]|uniref:Uncharacterized protein n=1 Tax=Paramecium tetraurelia TaxID=5888 RepID=A0DA48_PARTE|nr:uncharacterized protein GSPATT00039365001 [Paramecium tetraurelia]CAK79915.1 unnamed protein product [Paramecium tetraurelia]|eukprot:XP_001447312.1 hypothetical protein (macronuclear) [Paramecium tetraurelia strain d4-2]
MSISLKDRANISIHLALITAGFGKNQGVIINRALRTKQYDNSYSLKVEGLRFLKLKNIEHNKRNMQYIQCMLRRCSVS